MASACSPCQRTAVWNQAKRSVERASSSKCAPNAPSATVRKPDTAPISTKCRSRSGVESRINSASPLADRLVQRRALHGPESGFLDDGHALLGRRRVVMVGQPEHVLLDQRAAEVIAAGVQRDLTGLLSFR